MGGRSPLSKRAKNTSMSATKSVSTDAAAAWLVESSKWLRDAVLKWTTKSYCVQPGPVQILDLEQNKGDAAGLQCVLNDRIHCVRAVILPEAVDQWRAELEATGMGCAKVDIRWGGGSADTRYGDGHSHENSRARGKG